MRRPAAALDDAGMLRHVIAVALAVGCSSCDPQRPKPGAVVSGAVYGDHGAPVAGANLWFVDTAHLDTTKRHVGGCGTVYPQAHVFTDAVGRFDAELAFVPTQVSVSGPGDAYDPLEQLDVTGGVPSRLTLHAIDWQVVDVRATDASGTPLADVRVGYAAKTDATGTARFKVRRGQLVGEYRIRKIGFEPFMAGPESLGALVLKDRRTLVKVRVPAATDMRMVEAWQSGQKVSFCTAGDPLVTHEPEAGACTLDAAVGRLQLRIEGKVVKELDVRETPLEVTVEAPPLPPPAPAGNPY